MSNLYVPETYEVTVVCGNCGMSPTVIPIKKGLHIEEVPCENCGCTTLRLFV